MKRLKKHYSNFEPTIAALKTNYEKAMKEKMLMRLERDKMAVKVEALEQQAKSLESMRSDEKPDGEPEKGQKRTKKHGNTPIPTQDRANPFAETVFDRSHAERFTLKKTFKGHSAAISGLALHPSKPILATCSDDKSWKLWSVPNGDLIMSGDGHEDWLSCVDIHPRGTHLATSSGDGTVKLWNFARECCSATFTDHTQAVWGCAFHDMGDFMVSSSMDHTTRLWDLNSERCRQTYRGHVDSVNYVCFRPFSNNICTASGDKTVSFWDLKSGLCIQTFYGHTNAVNHVSFNVRGDEILSCDADGLVKVWDVRMVSERCHISTGDLHHAANEAVFDRSGKVVAVASDDNSIKIFSTEDSSHLGDLAGHEDSVQAVLFDTQSKMLISVSQDASFRIWS